tara:strand:- start:10176 stop:10433 length:258 start_codon:yes stop_codon:yes gene_type:complete
VVFKKDAVLNLRYEIKSMKSLPIIISGIIIMIFGIIFQFQGQGMIGPESSFMYENPSWINNGIYIGMVGVIIILIGYFVEKKKLM